MADLPAELKPLKRFIREAKKTAKVSPVISYYCRLYAIQEAMKLQTDTTKQWMSAQMDQLEQTAITVSKEEAQQIITSMAHKVFKHADEVDRAGNANKQTAAAFNSAYVFYTILKQFGDREEAIVEAAKYCMFKTTDILKALKEGRRPKPGPPGDDPEEDAALNAELNAISDDPAPSQPETQPPSQPMNAFPASVPDQNYNNGNEMGFGQNNNNNFSAPPSQPQQPSFQQPQYQQPVQPQYQQPAQPMQPMQPMQPQSGGGGMGGYQVTSAPQYNYQKRVQFPVFEQKVQACVAAENTLKEALAALRFEDTDTAIKKAEEAIAILTPHNH